MENTEIFNLIFMIIWSLSAIIFLFYELTTLNLVSIWFTIGSIFSLLAAALGLEYYWQLLIFAGTSLLMLIALKPLVYKFIKKTQNDKTNIDLLIGEEIKVLKIIDNDNLIAEAKLDGKIWTIIKKNNEPLLVNEKLKVIDVKGVKLIVAKGE